MKTEDLKALGLNEEQMRRLPCVRMKFRCWTQSSRILQKGHRPLST